MKTAVPTIGMPDRLLCSEYFVAVMDSQPVQVIQGGEAHMRFVRWGLGAFADGQQELLGVWPDHGSGALALRAVVDDLQTRGVEMIRFVVGAESSALLAASPGLRTLPTAPSGKSSSRRRAQPYRIATMAQEHVRKVKLRLNRAVRDHQSFDSMECARSFVDAVLRRVDCRLRKVSSLGEAAGGRPTRTVSNERRAPLRAL